MWDRNRELALIHACSLDKTCCEFQSIYGVLYLYRYKTECLVLKQLKNFLKVMP